METAVSTYLTEIGDAFLNPQKRVFLGYLGLALVIAAAVFLIAARGDRREGFAALRGCVLSPRVWWSASARADYKLFAINQAVMMGLAPRLLSHLALAIFLFGYFHTLVGVPPAFGRAAPAWAVVAGFTLAQFLLDDASRYLVHRLLHRCPLLWPFHKVHHSAETLTPMTVFRTHPVEGVLFALRSAAVHGTVIGGFVFFFGDKVDLVTVLGANVFLFAFNAAGANLRHSHVPISYGAAMERILVSPAQHQIHHSRAPEHFDRNFGSVLAIWDLVGGTLHRSEPGREIAFGVPADGSATGHGNEHRLARLYLAPFPEAIRAFGRGLRALKTTGANFVTMTSFLAAPRRLLGRARSATLTATLAAALALVPTGDAVAAGSKRLDIYSHRQPFLIEPFIKAFEKEAGFEVNIVYASRGLVQRLLAEGKRSPADLVLTVDIGRLAVYADHDLLQPVDSKVLRENIPAHLRDPKNRWFGFAKRVRVIAVSKDRVKPGSIKRMEDLADPKWKGRICTRPGSHVYNRALMASMIAAHGEAKAKAWAEGLVGNLARRPQGNDRAQLKAIYQGECDVAIINHYYWAKLYHGDIPAQKKWAQAARLVFPNQEDRGVHVNISGGGVTKHSDNKEGAVRFLEFLSKAQAQMLYASVNFEYPVNPRAEPSKLLKTLGDFKEDKLPIVRIAQLAPDAQRIIDQVGW